MMVKLVRLYLNHAFSSRLAMPDAMKTLGEAMLEKTFITAVPGALMAIIGGYLSYTGYFV